jgi:peptidoglycan/LPS O-acetylase OafA/YrhL
MLNHTWSLSIEEQFYICYPLLLVGYFSCTRNLRPLGFMLLFLALYSSYLMYRYFDEPENFILPYNRTDSRLSPIALGALAAVVQEASGWRANSFFASLGFAVIIASYYLAGFRMPFLYPWGFLLFAIAATLLVSHASGEEKSILRSVFSCGPLRRLGAISYGLYLWHFPVYVAVSVCYPGPQGFWQLSLATALSFLFTYLSYFLLERPCLKIKERFSSVHLGNRDRKPAALNNFSANASPTARH